MHGGLRPINLKPELCGGATGLACLENLNRYEVGTQVSENYEPAVGAPKASRVYTCEYQVPPYSTIPSKLSTYLHLFAPRVTGVMLTQDVAQYD